MPDAFPDKDVYTYQIPLPPLGIKGGFVNASGKEFIRLPDAFPDKDVYTYQIPLPPLGIKGGFVNASGKEWRGLYSYFSTIFFLPGVQSLLYQLKNLSSQEA